MHCLHNFIHLTMHLSPVEFQCQLHSILYQSLNFSAQHSDKIRRVKGVNTPQKYLLYSYVFHIAMTGVNSSVGEQPLRDDHQLVSQARIQWNFQREDNLGAEVLSFVRRLSLSWRFTFYCFLLYIYNNW